MRAETERERACVLVCVRVCVRVCKRQREKGRGRERERETGKLEETVVVHRGRSGLFGYSVVAASVSSRSPSPVAWTRC